MNDFKEGLLKHYGPSMAKLNPTREEMLLCVVGFAIQWDIRNTGKISNQTLKALNKCK
jgi:hypothetical protein